MNNLHKTKETLALIAAGIVIVVVGSLGAFLTVQYLLSAKEASLIPSGDPYAAGSNTNMRAYTTQSDIPAVLGEETTPAASASPSLSPTSSTFDLNPSPTILDLNTPTASATQPPTTLPETSTLPIWVLAGAGAMVLLIAAGFVL